MAKRYERVHTVTDYWDQPRTGVADFHGVPHAYQAVFDEAEDEWSDICLLRPIDDETFHLALEGNEIFERWLHAFHAGRTSLDTHPALPEDRHRHEEISSLLKPRMTIDPDQAIRARVEFRATSGSGANAQWQAHWQVVKESSSNHRSG
jgi:hypothetical protein